MNNWTNLFESKALLSPELQKQILEEVGHKLGNLPLESIRDRAKLREGAMVEVTNTAARLGCIITPEMSASLTSRAVAQIGGLGFIDSLLPPNRTDLSEIILNADGSLWVLKKGARDPEQLDYEPSLDEAWRAIEALLSPTSRSLSEATPLVDAKMPRMAGLGAGARISIVHPILAPGNGYPLLNIRLFEPKPVTLEQLLAWDIAPPHVLEGLLDLVSRGTRILISGGTYTGKTTLLSALANGIPKSSRVVKIEDPEEIWIDHPHVVTMEARPSPPGSAVPPVTVKDLVDKALRMSPRWLIVGEVRTGDVAMALFRAQMSDHPGLSTFHADSPESAVHRMALIMFTDRGVRFEAAKAAFAAAVNLVVQLGWLDGKRKIVGMWGVHKQLKGGDVDLEDLYIADGYHRDEEDNGLLQIREVLKGNNHRASSRIRAEGDLDTGKVHQ